MKILVVDNVGSAKGFKSVERAIELIPFNTIPRTYSEGLDQLAEQIIVKITNETSAILFIQTLLNVQDRNLQDMAGIELLKWLRIKGVSQHVVLFGSVLTAKELIQYKPEFLIVSSQGVTVTTAYFPQTSTIDFSKTFPIKTRGYLTPYIKAEFSMPEDERHNWANWWGIKKLYDVHFVYIEPIYPLQVQKQLRELRSAQAIYLYEIDKMGDLAKEKAKFNETHTIALQSRKPKILYIDDQAQDGWDAIFSMMFYGLKVDNNPYFKVFEPTYNDKEVDIVTKAFALFGSAIPDLVLIDLRLYKEAGARQDVENLSGAKVLDAIRQTYLGLPVIMVTASNKARSIEALEKLGCDAFWIKEGLDANMSPADTVENYFKLIRLVERTTGAEFQFLKRIGAKVKELDNPKNTFWWENHIWTRYEPTIITDKLPYNPVSNDNNKLRLPMSNSPYDINISTLNGQNKYTFKMKGIEYYFKVFTDNIGYRVAYWTNKNFRYSVSIQRSEIKEHLLTTIFLFKNIFKRQILGLGNQNPKEIDFLTNAILIEVAKIIEEIHRSPNDKYYDNRLCSGTWCGIGNDKKMFANEGDFVAGMLYIVRNSISHRTTVPSSTTHQYGFNFEPLIFFYSCFICWSFQKKFIKIDESNIKSWNTSVKLNSSLNQLKSIIKINISFQEEFQTLFGKSI